MILVEVLTSIDMRILVVDSEPAETALDDDLLQTAETAETAGVSTSLSCCHPGAHSSESATIGTFGLEVRDGCGKWRWKVNTKKGVGQKIQKIKYPYETKG